MKTVILQALLTGASVFSLWGQESVQHEFSLHVGGGVSTLRYHSAVPTPSGSAGVGLGVGYTCFFNSRWGVATGIEAGFFGGTLKSEQLEGVALQQYTYEGRSEPMHFNSLFSGYEERQRATYLHIPLMARYRQAIMDNHQLRAAAGLKFGFALAGSYDAKAEGLVTTGYFPESGRTFEDMPNHGFGAYTQPAWHGDLAFGFDAALALEAGVRWTLSERWGLYTGFFLDYGLTDVAPARTGAPLLRQDAAPDTFLHGSVTATQRQPDGTTYVGKMNLLSAGLQLRITL
jgi:hypothetical protein